MANSRISNIRPFIADDYNVNMFSHFFLFLNISVKWLIYILIKKQYSFIGFA